MNESEEGFDVPLGVTLLVVGSFGILSTLLLIAVILFFGYLKSDPPFIAIFSLAVADLVHLFIIVYHVVPELFSARPTAGLVEEMLMSHGNLWVWVVSLGHYSLIALNRLCAVVVPIDVDQYFSRKHVSIVCVVIWIAALLFALLPLSGACCRKIFDVHFDTEDVEAAAEVNVMRIMVCFLNVITFVIIVISYSAVGRQMWKRTQKKSSANCMSSLHHQQAKRAAMVSLQFGIISVIFTVLLGLNFATLIGHKNDGIVRGLQIFYSANSAVNPVVYCAFNATLRAQMMELLCMGKETLKAHHLNHTTIKSPIHPKKCRLHNHHSI